MVLRYFLSLCVATQVHQMACSGQLPKLVVVISVDQFPYSYLTRFHQHFERGGFNYLIEHGAVFANATYKHALNKTGPGHATISTGCYGNQNGIFANSWHDRESRRNLHCVEDRDAKPVGAASGGASPVLLLSSTIGDELRLATGFRSKVISVSLKDPAAVLLGGELANGVYWMVDSVFVSSTYYMESLPKWVAEFNRMGLVNSFFGEIWERFLPDSAYAIMDMDDAPYEAGGNGLGRTFPHRVSGENPSTITNSYYSAFRSSPFGNDVLAEFAKKAIQGESLGKDEFTDLLFVGFSSNDYVGHMYGPNSHEVLDMTVRTDRVLADLLSFLDSDVGLDKCIIVLTSDHGVTPIPEYVLAHSKNTIAGRVNERSIIDYGNALLSIVFGKLEHGNTWIDYLDIGNLYLNRVVIAQKKLQFEDVVAVLADSLRARKEVATLISREEMLTLTPVSPIEQRMKRSFHRERSGDILFAYRPYFIDMSGNTGTTHGQPYEYDAHVPVIFFGGGIAKGIHYSDASPADIAPTLSVLLGIGFPSGREGRVLVEALE